MTPDHRRRLQLAGEATAREVLAWREEVLGQEVTPELLAAGEARATAALRAVLGIAREPTAAAWSIELEAVEVAPDGRGPALRAFPVVDLPLDQLDDDDAARELLREIGAGFSGAAAPAYRLTGGRWPR